MNLPKELTVAVSWSDEDQCYVARTNLPGFATDGETIVEAIQSAADAVTAYLGAITNTQIQSESVTHRGVVTERLSRALAFARKAHEGQYRKGTTLPYISHPMAVAAIVFEHYGSEDQIIAALLHDTIEDCEVTREAIAAEFGEDVAQMVEECSDSFTHPKPPWKERKQAYLMHLREKVRIQTLFVSAADKLHNARAIVNDVRYSEDPESVWGRFNAPRSEVAWYYESLLSRYRKRLDAEASPPPALSRLLDEFDLAVARLVAGATTTDNRPALVWLGDSMASEPDEGWTYLQRFVTRDEALRFSKAYARFLVASADSGHEYHSGYQDNGSGLPHFKEWEYVHSVAATGPELDYDCTKDPEALRYPTEEDLTLIDKHHDTYGGTDGIRAWLKVVKLTAGVP